MTPAPTRRRDARPLAGLVVLALLATTFSLPARAALLDPAQALPVTAVVPIVADDVHQAHRQALASAYRDAVLQTALSLGIAAARIESRSADGLERYIAAYRVEEQTRRDLTYRLRLSVWVDRRLLREEVGERSGP